MFSYCVLYNNRSKLAQNNTITITDDFWYCFCDDTYRSPGEDPNNYQSDESFKLPLNKINSNLKYRDSQEALGNRQRFKISKVPGRNFEEEYDKHPV